MVGLIDCDNFFCSCERVFRPDLAGKPIVVLSNNDGCIVARSKEAKALGIPDCMPYHQMMQKYSDVGIIAFSSNYTLYGDMSRRIMEILRHEAPDVLQYSIDEAFLDLSGMGKENLKKWGEGVCQKILRHTGMPVSLGIASSKTLAKVASRFAKRYTAYKKCCFIDSDEQRIKALSIFPVGNVWGIGRKTCRTLMLYGISTAYQFASQSKNWIRTNFHLPGIQTWSELNGDDVIQIDGLNGATKQSIMTSRSFPGMITEKEILIPHIANYAARCANKLRLQNSVCSTLSVFIKSNHFRLDLPQYDNNGLSVFPTPTNTTTEIVEAALAILGKIYLPGIAYKRAGVMVSAISPANAIQPDLFFYDPERSRRYRTISSAMDNINSRMGADTIVLGAQQYADKDCDGKCVKFVNAIKRALKSPDYTTQLGAFTVG